MHLVNLGTTTRFAAVSLIAAATALPVLGQTSSSESTPTTTGQVLTVTLDTDGDVISEEVEEYIVSACADLSPAIAVNVVYTLDISGSMVNPDPATGGNPPTDILPPRGIGPEDDLNGDGIEGSTLDAAIAGLQALNRSFESLPDVEVAVVAFGNGALTADMNPAAGQQDFTGPRPGIDNSGNGEPDVNDVVSSAQTVFQGNGVAGFLEFTNNLTPTLSYQTNYDAALTEANAVLAAQPGSEANIIFMLTDGVPTTFTTGPGSPLQATVDAGYSVNTYGVGAGAVGLCDPGEPLDVIASSTNGTCTEVLDPADLIASLPGGSETDIDELVITVNDAVVAMASGPQAEQLCIDPLDILANLAPAENTITATATATDGTESSTSQTINKTMCLLMLGFDDAYVPLGGVDYLLTQPNLIWSVTQVTCPDINIPNNPQLMGMHVYLQVAMYNEVAFPSDPLQLSNGVDVEIGGDWTIYGSAGDILLWLNQDTPVGGVIDPGFFINGL